MNVSGTAVSTPHLRIGNLRRMLVHVIGGDMQDSKGEHSGLLAERHFGDGPWLSRKCAAKER